MHQPLVSVICLCHNHNEFVEESIQSVLKQDYPSIELIVVDDGSTDGSKKTIELKLAGTKIKFISIPSSIGHCAAFNKGFIESSGKYIIDLASDDELLSERISQGVQDLERAGESYGVHFTDAILYNSSGQRIGTHYKRDSENRIIEQIPQGNIYKELIGRYFICPPSMMIRRSILEEMDGYDESLEYEDFDFWIRSSRNFQYVFNPLPLTMRRMIHGSDSKKQFSPRNKHGKSTLKVCKKIFDLNLSKDEDKALVKRCYYEIRQCIKSLNLELIPAYLQLIAKTKSRKFA